jgi:hypothetical protein
MNTTHFGAMANYTRGFKAGQADAKANKDFADLTGINDYYKDGYSKGYRA